MHTIVPEIVTTAASAVKARKLMMRHDPSLAKVIDLQPVNTSLRMPNTFKATPCPECNAAKKNDVAQEREFRFCNLCHCTRFLFKDRVHTVRQVLSSVQTQQDEVRNDLDGGQALELAKWAVCCPSFALSLSSIRRTTAGTALDTTEDERDEEEERMGTPTISTTLVSATPTVTAKQDRPHDQGRSVRAHDQHDCKEDTRGNCTSVSFAFTLFDQKGTPRQTLQCQGSK